MSSFENEPSLDAPSTLSVLAQTTTTRKEEEIIFIKEPDLTQVTTPSRRTSQPLSSATPINSSTTVNPAFRGVVLEDGQELGHSSPTCHVDGDQEAPTVSLAFSGGGIRSASFCGGVLCDLIEDGQGDQRKTPVKISKVSCVSGGGYTGSGWLHWRKTLLDSEKDHPSPSGPATIKQVTKMFLNRMRKHSAYLIEWVKPFSLFKCGCPWSGRCFLSFSVFLAYLLFTNIVCFFLLNFAPAFAFVAAVDCIFETSFTEETPDGTWRETDQAFWIICVIYGCAFCMHKVSTTFKMAAFRSDKYEKVAPCFRLSRRMLRAIGDCFNMMAFLALILATSLLFAFLGVLIKGTNDQLVFGVLFIARLLIPSMFLFSATPRAGVIVFVSFLFGEVLQYLFYEVRIFGIPYRDEIFEYATYAAWLSIMFHPPLRYIQSNLSHQYYRWRLQRAFYNQKHSCAGICGTHEGMHMTDLKDVTITDPRAAYPHTEFISNVTANLWLDKGDPPSLDYKIISVHPTRWDIQDEKRPESHYVKGEAPPATTGAHEYNVHVRDLQVAEVMALSGAAVANSMGMYKAGGGLIGLTGLGLGKWVFVTKFAFWRVVGWVIVYVAPSLTAILCLWLRERNEYYYWGSLAGMSYMIVLMLVFPMLNNILWIRNWVMQIPLFQLLSETANVMYVRSFTEASSGAYPHPLYISDGGHAENLGALPLFQQGEKYIIICDGGLDSECSLADLSNLLNLARKLYRCRFASFDEHGDLEADIQNFASTPKRSLCFRVFYAASPETCGYVWYLKPRALEKETPGREMDIHHQDGDWYKDFPLDSRDLDSTLKEWDFMCPSPFPNHDTFVFQLLFHRKLHDAYHREGHRAVLEFREFCEKASIVGLDIKRVPCQSLQPVSLTPLDQASLPQGGTYHPSVKL